MAAPDVEPLSARHGKYGERLDGHRRHAGVHGFDHDPNLSFVLGPVVIEDVVLQDVRSEIRKEENVTSDGSARVDDRLELINISDYELGTLGGSCGGVGEDDSDCLADISSPISY
jgi:hypothetical protein